MNFDNFPQNKYTNWYKTLINSRQLQEKKLFKTESHHVFPISIFGKNKITINLTIREHYIAHLLLMNMYKDTIEYSKMLFAIDMMSITRNNLKINSKLFEMIKINVAHEHSKKFTKYWSHPENREAQSKRRKEHLRDPENYKKMCETNKKLANTKEWKEQRSRKQKELSSNKEYTELRVNAMNTPKAKAKAKLNQKLKNESMSKEERKATYSRNMTDEYKKKISDNKKGKKKIFNKDLKSTKMSKGVELESYLNSGWILWTSIPKAERQKI